MKVAIDTRHDTLEEALAVVELAFGSSSNGAVHKSQRPATRATPGRKKRGRRSVVAEPEAASTATKASLSEANGSRRRTGAGPTAARKATNKKTTAKKASSKKSAIRKAVKTGPGTSGTVAEPGTATKAAASKAPATRAVSNSAIANGTGVNAKRVAVKKTTATKRPKPANVAPPGQSDTIRTWARSQGMQVADIGRMSAAVIAAYNAKHN